MTEQEIGLKFSEEANAYAERLFYRHAAYCKTGIIKQDLKIQLPFKFERSIQDER